MNKDILQSRVRIRLMFRATPLMLVAASLTLVACGSSSSAPKSSSTTAAVNARRTAIRSCLSKQGINLPQRPPGGAGGTGAPGAPGTTGGGGLNRLFGGGPRNGDPRMRAALKKCGITFRRGSPFFSTAAGKKALSEFVACVRKNGYRLPAPNTSGNGPVFNPSKVNRTNPKLIVAAAKCQHLLPRPRFGRGGFGGPPSG